jgi:hypothetical protein
MVSGPVGNGTAGGTITAGMPLYKDTTDGNALKPGDASAAASAAFAGIALNGAADGQPVAYAKPGATINWGATLAKGTLYVISATAGGVAPVADLASGEYITALAVGIGTANAKVIGVETGVAVD